jgi:anti-sigma B factor antagonist
MRIEITKVFDVIIIRLSGTFTEEVDLKRGLEGMLPSTSPNVLVNFEHVDYINSSCFRSLAKFHQKIASVGGDVRLCTLQPQVRQLFAFAKLDAGFHIYASEDEGIISYYSKLPGIEALPAGWAYSG